MFIKREMTFFLLLLLFLFIRFSVSLSRIAPKLIIVLLTIITLYEKHCNHRSQVDEVKLS
jgi:hypothetical protein